eukprot:m.16900 g.16900  ORF g.16900 m.16900 type:complete len:206 (-) comp11262_c0_seq1:45-662(-)
MSILGCVVDCTSSRIEGVGGAFVSVVLLITEIDTSMMGFGDATGGVGNIMNQLNAEGLNITNDIKTVVGIGFQFTNHRLQAEDIMKTIDWTSYTSEVSNLTVQNIIPNMTEAMVAYETKHPYTPSIHTHGDSNTTIIIVAVVFAALLVGVLVGVLVRKASSKNHRRRLNNVITPTTDRLECVTNNDYADSLDMRDNVENEQQSDT